MSRLAECGCPESGGKIRHQRSSCTDPVVAKLNWYASDGPASCRRGCPEGECYCSEPTWAEMNGICTSCSGLLPDECYCDEQWWRRKARG